MFFPIENLFYRGILFGLNIYSNNVMAHDIIMWLKHIWLKLYIYTYIWQKIKAIYYIQNYNYI